MSEYEHLSVDPYRDLMRSHRKFNQEYKFEFCNKNNVFIIVAQTIISPWVQGKDPGYLDLSDPFWEGCEYGYEDKLPKFAIATPSTLYGACARKIPDAEMTSYWRRETTELEEQCPS